MKTHLAHLVLVALLAGRNEGDSGADAADAYPSSQDLSSGAPQALMVTPQRQWIARDESASNKVESVQASGTSQEATQERRIAEVQSWQYELNPQVLKSTWQAQRDAWSPIRDAWHNMGRTFAQSIAAASLKQHSKFQCA